MDGVERILNYLPTMVKQWVASTRIADGLDIVVDKRPQLEMA